MFVNFNILNQLGSPAINSNTFANRPAAGQTGRLFVSTDTYEIYRDNGTTWDLIGGPGSSTITGTGTATQVAYFTSSQAIGSSANLFWDNTSGFLGVATATPTARIEAVKTDGVGIYANFTTNAGSGSSTTALWAKNVTNSSGFAAVIEETTPNTTAGQYPLLIKHSLSSGTAGVGMGTGLHFQLPDDAGTFKTTQLTIETIDAAAATYKTRYRFNVQNNGTGTPVAYINATGLGIFVASPSGLIHADGGASAARMILDADAGVARIFSFRSDNLPRWAFRVDGAESGSNAGADLAVRAYNDAGTFTIAPLSINRATGKTTFQATETYSTGLARANYLPYNLTVAAGGSFTSPNAVTALGASLILSLAGNATVPSGARSGLDAYNNISFTGTGTLTQGQGTQIRAFSNLTTGWTFAGSATGTITHLAGLRVLFPDNTGSAVTVTNNYALLLNDQTANTGTVTYTNRWGVYQEGASDLNYMAANLLLGTTVNSGEKLVISGNVYATGTVSIGATSLASTLKLYAVQASGEGNPTLDGSEVAAFQRNFVSAQSASVAIVSGTASTSSLYFGDKDSISIGKILYDNASNYLAFNTNAAERVRITSAGLLGIGTSSPTEILELSTLTDPKIRFVDVGNLDAKVGIVSSTALGFEVNGTERARINSGGTFRVNSAGITNNATLEFESSATPSSGSLIAVSYTGSGSYGPLRFSTSGTEQARLTAGGNVLIGTTTDDGYLLQVNGTIKQANYTYHANNAAGSMNGATWITTSITLQQNTLGVYELYAIGSENGRNQAVRVYFIFFDVTNGWQSQFDRMIKPAAANDYGEVDVRMTTGGVVEIRANNGISTGLYRIVMMNQFKN